MEELALNIIQTAQILPSLSLPFYYPFSTEGTLDESSTILSSTSPFWSVTSGAQLWIKRGRGQTIQRELPANDKWRLLYSTRNPIDTDNGYHPQNTFRLVSKGKWHNISQEVYFKINRINPSASPNRNASNGFLLMADYSDQYNLYYAGIRVDGNAVIKKKINGIYYTLAIKPFYPGTYSRSATPNLIPTGRWIGVKSVVASDVNKTFTLIRFYIDRDKTGSWTLAAEALDDGRFGNPPFTQDGHTGIRTDFMDAEFDDYRVKTN